MHITPFFVEKIAYNCCMLDIKFWRNRWYFVQNQQWYQHRWNKLFSTIPRIIICSKNFDPFLLQSTFKTSILQGKPELNAKLKSSQLVMIRLRHSALISWLGIVRNIMNISHSGHPTQFNESCTDVVLNIHHSLSSIPHNRHRIQIMVAMVYLYWKSFFMHSSWWTKSFDKVVATCFTPLYDAFLIEIGFNPNQPSPLKQIHYSSLVDNAI